MTHSKDCARYPICLDKGNCDGCDLFVHEPQEGAIEDKTDYHRTRVVSGHSPHKLVKMERMKYSNKKKEEQMKFDDELCICGHSKGYHKAHELEPHGGPCEKCNCMEYTWGKFVVYKEI